MKDRRKAKKRPGPPIGFCLVPLVVFLTVSLQSAFREKPLFTGNSSLFNHGGDDHRLFSSGYWAGLNISGREPGEPIKDKPRVSTGKLFGEIFVGMLGNFGGAFLGAVIGTVMIRDDGEGLIPVGTFLGMFPGSIFGSALGVYAIGNIGEAKGSFGKALLGSLLGEGAAIAISLLLNNGTVTAISFITFPPIGAALLFNRSLKYKSLPVTPALVNFHQGDFKIGIPYVHIQPLRGYGKDVKIALQFSVNLVNIVF